MYGIHAAGDGTLLDLLDVDVLAGDAGKGGIMPVIVGNPGARQCTGHSTCCDPATPGCGSTSGPTPPPAPGAGAVAPSGSFDAANYVPGNGSAGPAGTNGYDGREGGDGQDLGNVCWVGGNCGTCLPLCSPTPGVGTCQGGSQPSGFSSLAGESGRCGCGGLGGSGGSGGRGGGASVSLFVGTGAKVTASYSSFRSGKGGDGGAGATGSSGGFGTDGAAGASASCVTGCYSQCFGTCQCTQSTTATGGSAGTAGGLGGPGAMGGGGSGGPSFSIATGSGGVFTDGGNNVFLYKSGGSGAAGSPSGRAGTRSG
jgi:hypothetical protein